MMLAVLLSLHSGLQPGQLLYCSKCGMQPILLSPDRLRGTCTSCSSVVVDLELESQQIDKGIGGMQVDEGKQMGHFWCQLSVVTIVFSASVQADSGCLHVLVVICIHP